MYTKEDVIKVEEGLDLGGGYYWIGETRFECKYMVTFKDGKKCLAHSVDNAIYWMNQLVNKQDLLSS